MSKVTKTILILQLDSWIAAHSRASCCSLSAPSLPALHFHWETSTPSTGSGQCRRPRVHFNVAAFFARPLSLAASCSSRQGPGCWPRPAVSDRSFSLSRDVSVSCLAVQTVGGEVYSLRRPACLHFIQTLAWSHSNPEDPASLCWAGKRRHKRRLIWIFGGGVSVTACRELPQCFWRCQMLFASISTGRSEVPLLKLVNSQLFKISFPSKQLTKQNQENDWVDTSIFPLIWKQRYHSLCYLQSKFCPETFEQCQAGWPKQGKKFPNNGQTGNPLCLLACFSPFERRRMPGR